MVTFSTTKAYHKVIKLEKSQKITIRFNNTKSPTDKLEISTAEAVTLFSHMAIVDPDEPVTPPPQRWVHYGIIISIVAIIALSVVLICLTIELAKTMRRRQKKNKLSFVSVSTDGSATRR